jgi:hypothetical protein
MSASLEGIKMRTASEQMQSSAELPSANVLAHGHHRFKDRFNLLVVRWRRAGIWRNYDTREAFAGACDAEVRQLTAPDARLDANAVRWDVIGATTSGRRCRI